MGAYIEYAKGGTDFRTKGTISCWVKRSELGREQYIWGWGENNSSDSYLRFDTADNLEFHVDGAGGTFNTTRLFKDTNAWYHIVCSLDGANATDTLRRRMWVNGVQIQGPYSEGTFSGAVMGWHSTQDLWIGANPRQQQASGHQYFNGLISHFHYCSNYSYAASDFGEFDSTTGEWKIKTDPSVNYGSEGFFLKMEDSSNMDLDSSGNNKTLTTTGTVTATQDCPSNVFCVLNPLDKRFDNTTLTNGNLTCTGGRQSTGYDMIRGTIGNTSGKYYFEVKAVDNGEVDQIGIGILNGISMQNEGASGLNGNCQGYGVQMSNGYKVGVGQSGTAYMGGFSANDICMVAVDLDNDKITFGRNGQWANGSGGADQTYANSTAAFTGLNDDRGYIPMLAMRDSGANNTGTMQFNFGNGYFGTTAVSSAGTNASGNGIFEYDVPAGFTALSTKGINSF